MADGRFVLPGPDTISMSGDTAKRLIGGQSGDAALLYIYILTRGGVFDQKDAETALGRSASQIQGAVNVLSRLGLIRGDFSEAPTRPEPAEELPQYSIEDIKREIENGAVFSQLTKSVQSALGKMLSPDDLIRLFGIYDHLGLPPEVILILVTYCRDTYAARYGSERTPTMKYIEKAAYTWERENIFSLEAAEEYLSQLSRINDLTEEFAALLQIRSRALTASERRYITSWINMGFTREAVLEAYDRTVLKTGKLAWRYMDSIMQNWHSKGIHTAGDIEEKDLNDRGRAGKEAPAVSPAAQGPTRDDLQHIRDTLRRIKGE